MKTLLLIRHAKSSWDNIEQSDFDRPLNERGKKDAPEMAERLKEKIPSIDLIVSSPAKRAKKTAKIFADAFKIDKEIKLDESLYEAHPEMYYEVIKRLPDNKNVIAIFAHNPGITGFANMLSNVHVDDMPTCGIFAVSADTASWAHFRDTDKKFLFFDYPRNPLAD